MSIKIQSDGPICCSDDGDERFLDVHIPTDANTALALELDDMVEIVIKGKVKEVEASKGHTWRDTPGSVRVQVDSINVDGKNAFADLVED